MRSWDSEQDCFQTFPGKGLPCRSTTWCFIEIMWFWLRCARPLYLHLEDIGVSECCFYKDRSSKVWWTLPVDPWEAEARGLLEAQGKSQPGWHSQDSTSHESIPEKTALGRYMLYNEVTMKKVWPTDRTGAFKTWRLCVVWQGLSDSVADGDFKLLISVLRIEARAPHTHRKPLYEMNCSPTRLLRCLCNGKIQTAY